MHRNGTDRSIEDEIIGDKDRRRIIARKAKSLNQFYSKERK
jgi:hypothetical protein